MVRIRIGQNIAAQRARRGITQGQLAECVGVSKSAVSKWELGQSCPDISLLPVLAAYFDITVDELLGYEPQVSMDEIVHIRDELAESFEKRPFAEVKMLCRHYLCRYPASWPLLFAIGQLLITYASKTDCPETTNAVYQKALELFIKVAKGSKDATLKKRAGHMQAVCYLLLGHTEEAIELLNGQIGFYNLAEPLLAEAEMKRGDRFRAQGIVRIAFLLSLSSILLVSAELIEFMSDSDQIDMFLDALIQIAQVLPLERLAPRAYLTVILAGAKHYVAQGRKAEALELFSSFARFSKKGDTKTKIASSKEQGSWGLSRALLSVYTGEHAVVHHVLSTRLFKDPIFDSLRPEPVFQEVLKWHRSYYAKRI